MAANAPRRIISFGSTLAQVELKLLDGRLFNSKFNPKKSAGEEKKMVKMLFRVGRNAYLFVGSNSALTNRILTIGYADGQTAVTVQSVTVEQFSFSVCARD